MKKLFALITLLIPAELIYSQKQEHYDIASYIPPAGWTKEGNDFGISYVATDKLTGDWCRIMIFKSTNSSGEPMTDFDNEWNALVAKQYKNTTKPTPQLSSADGWTALSGVSKFSWQEQEPFVLLNTITGYGKELSLLVITNGQAYMSQVESFLNSIDLKKPLSSGDEPITVDADTSPARAAISTGITKYITRFEDGWTAYATDDWVAVAKENTRLYLHYGFTIPAGSSAGEGPTTQENWNRFITPRYNISEFRLNPDVGSWGGAFNYYAEGTGSEMNTGAPVFIGFRTFVEAGAYFCVEAVSPNRLEFEKHLPSLQMFKDMRNSNRFAVTLEDIVGDWSSSGSSALQYYNVYTGQSAGMQFSQGDQTFSFEATGEYNARISGAIGTMGGPQTVFDNKYAGQTTVTDWEITLTKYGGQTQVFTAHFEAVKGGRILHIAKKDAPGVSYALIKMK